MEVHLELLEDGGVAAQQGKDGAADVAGQGGREMTQTALLKGIKEGNNWPSKKNWLVVTYLLHTIFQWKLLSTLRKGYKNFSTEHTRLLNLKD